MSISKISKMIEALNMTYATVSVNRMEELCNIGGVEYRDPSQASTLLKELYQKGYKLRVSKQMVEDVAIGQILVLRDLSGAFIRGYQIWIDFKDDYEVKDIVLYSEADIIDFNEGR